MIVHGSYNIGNKLNHILVQQWQNALNSRSVTSDVVLPSNLIIAAVIGLEGIVDTFFKLSVVLSSV